MSINERNIRFSIITPVYNREDCIGRCIDSVIEQKYDNLEMWIIDDGSTDQTQSIIHEYQKKYSFIKLHRFEHNKGVNAARNYGIQNSDSDFSILLDSDDYFTTDALHTILSAVNKYPEYNQYMFSQNDRMLYYQSNEKLSAEINKLSFSDFLLGKVSGDFTHAINSKILKQYPFPEKLRIYEGINFLKIYKHCVNQLFVNKLVVERERNRNDSVTLEYKLSNTDSIKKKYTAQRTLLETFEDDYIKFDNTGFIVEKIANDSCLLSIASGIYNLSFFEELLSHWNKKVPLIYKICASLRMGFIIRLLIFTVSKAKL